jgi:hypothetical protein
MNSKKNSFKRVAAGALAVLTVAAYTTPVANVGGLSNSSFILSADAAEAVKYSIEWDGNVKPYLTSFNDGVSSSSLTADALVNLNSYDATVGKTVTFKSKVPLKFYQALSAYNGGYEEGAERLGDNWYVKDDAAVATFAYAYKTVGDGQAAVPAAAGFVKDGEYSTDLPSTEEGVGGCKFYAEEPTVERNATNDGYVALTEDNDRGTYAIVERVVNVAVGDTKYKAVAPTAANVVYSATYALIGDYKIYSWDGDNVAEYQNDINDFVNDGVLNLGDNKILDHAPQTEEDWRDAESATEGTGYTKTYTKAQADVAYSYIVNGVLTAAPATWASNDYEDQVSYYAGTVNDLKYATNGTNYGVYTADNDGVFAIKNVAANTGNDVTDAATKYKVADVVETAAAIEKVWTAPVNAWFKENNDGNLETASEATTAYDAVQPQLYKRANASVQDGDFDFAPYEYNCDLLVDELPAYDAEENKDGVKETVNNGIYTYTFTMPKQALADEENGHYSYLFVDTLYEDADLIDKGANAVDGLDDAGQFKHIVVGSTVKVSADAPFTLEVNDHFASNNLIKPELKFEDNRFYAEFTMPANADFVSQYNAYLTDYKNNHNQSEVGAKTPEEFDKNDYAENVTLTVEKLDTSDFSYKVSGNALTVTSKKAALSNLKVASVETYEVAKAGTGLSKDKYEETEYYYLDANKDDEYDTLANGAEIVNGRGLVFEAPDEVDFAGSEIAVVVKVKKPNAEGAVVYDGSVLTEAGVYTVTTEFTIGTVTYTSTQTFTIAAKSAITANNVKLTINDKKDTVEFINKILKGSKNGVATFKLTKDSAETSEFTVTPALVDSDGVALKKTVNGNEVDLENLTDYEITGAVSGSTLNKTYTFTVKIYNGEYGGSKTSPKTFTVSWMLKPFEQESNFDLKDGGTAQVSQDNIEDLEDKVFAAALPNDTAKANRSSYKYEYVKGTGAALTEDELDEYIKGLPSETGDYTVYITQNGEHKARVMVKITEHALYLNAKNLKYTYGDDFDFNKYTLTDASGKAVTNITASNIKPTFYASIAEKDTNNNVVYKQGAKIGDIDDLKDEEGFVDAGTYFVSFEADSSDDTYTIISELQLLTVAKKKLTADMVFIEPIAYTGETYDIVTAYADRQLIARDPATGAELNVKITEGTKEKAIGSYKATVTLDGENNGDNKNYTGTIDADWYICAKEAVNVDTGLKWNDEMSTIYENGKIHVELNRNANDKVIDKKNGNSKIGVKAFGVICDLDETFGKPVDYDEQTNEDPAYALAEQQLVYGGKFEAHGYGVTSTTAASTKTTYKANFKVRNVDTGIWARPFIVLEDNTVVYGDVKYLNLAEEAVRKLDLNMSPKAADKTAVRRADIEGAKAGDEGIRSGYNPLTGKTYVYAYFTDLKTAGFPEGSVLDVKDFGVVVDNKGLVKEQEDAKKVLIANDKAVLTGHYKKDSTKLQTNEYAANVKHVDGVTGVWARPYVDLGGGLIVYGDADYFESDTEYFNSLVGGKAVKMEASYSKDTGRATFAIDEDDCKIPEIDAEVKLAKVGVVADKEGSLATAKDDAERNAKLILNKGYKQGGKTELDGDWEYIGKLTPGADTIYARAYATYAITKDNTTTSITVYGDVETVNKNEEPRA